MLSFVTAQTGESRRFKERNLRYLCGSGSALVPVAGAMFQELSGGASEA
jgi:hypothetical protein